MYTFLFFLIGCCLGSFIPCFAERREKNLSQTGRSQCMVCGKTLSAFELIPIIGFLFCQGRCRNCHNPIPKIFPFLEALLGLISAYLWLCIQSPLHTLLLIATFCLLLLLSLDDCYTLHIHDSDLIIYTAILLTDSLLFGEHLWLNQITGALLMGITLFLIAKIFPAGLGSGDILFMIISGFYLGIPNICYAFCLGILFAVVYAIFRLINRSATRKTAIPLIPFLSIGTALLLLLFFAQKP